MKTFNHQLSEYQEAGRLIVRIQHALQADEAALAIQLATEGAAKYPQNAMLRAYAVVLAPPKIRRLPATASDTLKLSQEWLAQNAEVYSGQWVAVRDGMFVAAEPKLAALLAVVGDESMRARTLIAKVV